MIINLPTKRTIRYDTRCYFNVRSKADISQLNLPHGKACLSDIRVTNISKSFTHKMAAKTSWHTGWLKIEYPSGAYAIYPQPVV